MTATKKGASSRGGFARLKHTLRQEGLLSTTQSVLRRLGALARIRTAGQIMEARRKSLSAEIFAKTGGTVSYGPIRGFRMPATAVWDAGSVGSMLLGLYEREFISRIASEAGVRSTLIDIGAADGYIGVGLVKSGHFSESICFEITESGREQLRDVIAANGVAEFVRVLGEATPNSVAELVRSGDVDMRKSVVVIDIEGAEFDLLSHEMIGLLRDAVVYIELHELYFADGLEHRQRLEGRLSEVFSIDEISYGYRDPGSIPELSGLHDHDRWLLCSEGRSIQQSWLRLARRAEVA